MPFASKTLILHNINMQQNNPKIFKAWAMYDWANSAYNLIINSAIFPSYFTAIVPLVVSIGAYQIKNDTLAAYAISVAYFIIANISPILGAIADYKGNKKFFMKLFCTIGSLSCMGLFWFQKSNGHTNIVYGVVLSILACIGYCGSLVFYNAYLPQIATPDKQDELSAKGFAMGYIGSVSLLIVCLAFIMLNDKLHWVASSLPARISFLLVGLWWYGWSTISFKTLPDGQAKLLQAGENIYTVGYKQLKQVAKAVWQHQVMRTYLLSFLFITMGVQTVMFMATYFAAIELSLQTAQLIIVILLIQIVAIGGAWLFARISKQYGNKLSLLIMLVIWVGICIAASQKSIINNAASFYILAFVVGAVMGGVQSTSRSTFSKLLPATADVASYFSIYDVVEKSGIILGLTSFGYLSTRYNLRISAICLAVYFVIAIIILQFIKFNFTRNDN
jgi:MFS transporter, UMF1 family